MPAPRPIVLPEALPAVPRNHEELRALIVERHAGLSRQLQKIARFVLDYPNHLALETVAQIAKRADVQPSALVRFAQALGYDGFTDLQQVFRSHLILGFSKYEDRVDTLGSVAQGESAGFDGMLDGFVREGVDSLRMLRERTAERDLAQAVRLLAGARQVYAIAQGRSFPVAYYLAFALGRLERRCQLLDGIGGVLREQADLAEPQDAVLAVSFRPYTPLVIDIVGGLAKKRVPVVAITDSPVSPLAQAATVSFHIQEGSDRVFKSLIAPMCLAQTLAVALGHHLAGSSTTRAARRRK